MMVKERLAIVICMLFLAGELLCQPDRGFAAGQYQQVAQLWQRYGAKFALFLINVQLYSQNHKIAFFEPHQGQYKHFYCYY